MLIISSGCLLDKNACQNQPGCVQLLQLVRFIFVPFQGRCRTWHHYLSVSAQHGFTVICSHIFVFTSIISWKRIFEGKFLKLYVFFSLFIDFNFTQNYYCTPFVHIHVVYEPELFYFSESILNIPWRPLTAEVTPYIGTVEVSNIPINRKAV